MTFSDAYVRGTLALFCLALAGVVVAVWIPRAGRLLALYGLHQLRDRLYAAARSFPPAETARLYRDAELYFCIIIKLVREGTHRDVLLLVLLSATADNSNAGNPQRHSRTALYSRERQELFSGEKGQQAHDTIVDAALRSRRFVQLYAILGHPLLQIVGVLLAIWKFVTWPTRLLASTPVLAELFSEQVNTVRKVPTNRNLEQSPLQLLRRMGPRRRAGAG